MTSKFWKFGAWLPTEAMKQSARDFALNIVGRHDVPQEIPAFDDDGNLIQAVDAQGKLLVDANGKPVWKMVPPAPDLRDTISRFWGTKDGRSVAEVMKPHDLWLGSESAITPIMMLLTTFLTVLAMSIWSLGMAMDMQVIAKVLSGACAVLALIIFHAMWMSIGGEGNRLVLGIGVALPVMGTLLSQFSSALPLPTGSGVMAQVALPLLILTFAGLLTIGKMFFGKRASVSRTPTILSGLAVTMFAASFLPAWLQPLYWFALACSAPYLHERMLRMDRAGTLAALGARHSGDVKQLGNENPAVRLEQAIMAEKDKSGFIELGTSLGKVTKMGDGFASDPGLPFGHSCEDLRTHEHVFGQTGGGKTFNIMMKVPGDWIHHDAGGTVYFDGKASLGLEILAKVAHLPGVVLVKPGVRLALIEGLSPEDLVEALFDVGGAKNIEKKEENSEFFQSQAKTLALNLAYILDAAKRIQTEQGVERTYFWTIKHLDRLKMMMRSSTEHSQALLNWVRENPVGEPLLCEIVVSACEYFEQDFWVQPDNQLGGIVSTLDTMLKPLFSDRELRPWTEFETGVDVCVPLFGGHMGTSLPEAQHGNAGKLCQSLIKQRLFSKIKRRSTYDWRAMGETPVLFVVDEAQELISAADRAFLPVSRSLGGYCLYSTQNVDAYEARMGEAATRSFLDNFRSAIVLQSSAKTYEWLSTSWGSGRFVRWKSSAPVIGFIETAKKLAGHPVFNKNHPLKNEMRKLRRQGAGMIVNPQERAMVSNGALLGGVDNHFHDDLEIDSLHATAVALVKSEDIEEGPLLRLSDCAKELTDKRVAIASVRRGEAIRRDFIRFPELTDGGKARQRKLEDAILFNAVARPCKRLISEIAGQKLSKVEAKARLWALLYMGARNEEFFAKAMGPMTVEDIEKLNGVLTNAKVRSQVETEAQRDGVRIQVVVEAREDLENR